MAVEDSDAVVERWTTKWDAYQAQRGEHRALGSKVSRGKESQAVEVATSDETALRGAYREAMADAFGEDLDELRRDENFEASPYAIEMLVEFLGDGVDVLSAEQRQHWER
jgi:hypothetical protein